MGRELSGEERAAHALKGVGNATVGVVAGALTVVGRALKMGDGDTAEGIHIAKMGLREGYLNVKSAITGVESTTGDGFF